MKDRIIAVKVVLVEETEYYQHTCTPSCVGREDKRQILKRSRAVCTRNN